MINNADLLLESLALENCNFLKEYDVNVTSVRGGIT